jgi:hypothetical protein
LRRQHDLRFGSTQVRLRVPPRAPDARPPSR